MKKKRKVQSYFYTLLASFALVLLCIIYADAAEKKSEESFKTDIITFGAMAAFGKLDEPPVVFLHDKHTQALSKQGKDCETCHLTEKDKLSFKFKRLEDTSKQAVMEIYHTNCVGCHNELADAGKETGPVICGRCHVGEDKFASARQPMGWDISLHYRHVSALEAKCELCHHEYDEKTGSLFYAEGEEGSCRYCHKEQQEGNTSSFSEAAHSSCLNCHQEKLAAHKDTGPVQCAGCHDLEKQKSIKKLATVPRIKRNQPDFVLIKSDLPLKETRMSHVPFDHQSHEASLDTCRSCHHEDLNLCSSCHTVKGAVQGKGVTLERAMHRLDSESSCIGCHEAQQADPKCAGCHSFMEKRYTQASGCVKCHMDPRPAGSSPREKAEERIDARLLLQARKAVVETFDDNEIPETVTINELSDIYGPVEFPHRKIVRALMDNVKENKLAQYFHNDQATICQGCHHNSPTAKQPPRCGNCHGMPSDEKLAMPGLKGAYHQQCLGCHREMDVKKPSPVACADCHEKLKITTESRL
jgi:hypothetical protein